MSSARASRPGPGLRPLVALALVLAAAHGAASCAEAGGTVTGGELTEAGVMATATPIIDAGDPELRARVERACSTPEWEGLYREVFGPADRRPGSCTFNETCHGTPEGAGARSTVGLKCFSERGCCESMFYDGLVRANSARSPDRAPLITVLRRPGPDGGTRGYMPKEPADYVFPEETLERIKDWIRLSAAPEDGGAGDGGAPDAADAGDDATPE